MYHVSYLKELRIGKDKCSHVADFSHVPVVICSPSKLETQS